MAASPGGFILATLGKHIHSMEKILQFQITLQENRPLTWHRFQPTDNSPYPPVILYVFIPISRQLPTSGQLAYFSRQVFLQLWNSDSAVVVEVGLPFSDPFQEGIGKNAVVPLGAFHGVLNASGLATIVAPVLFRNPANKLFICSISDRAAVSPHDIVLSERKETTPSMAPSGLCLSDDWLNVASRISGRLNCKSNCSKGYTLSPFRKAMAFEFFLDEV